jgi:hypothetical protein
MDHKTRLETLLEKSLRRGSNDSARALMRRLTPQQLARVTARLAFLQQRAEDGDEGDLTLGMMQRDSEGRTPGWQRRHVARVLVAEPPTTNMRGTSIWFVEAEGLLMLPSAVVRDGATGAEVGMHAVKRLTGIEARVTGPLAKCADEFGDRSYYLGWRVGGAGNTGSEKCVLLPSWEAVNRLTSPFDQSMVLSVTGGMNTAMHERKFACNNESVSPTGEQAEPLQLALHQLSIPLFNPADPIYEEDRRAALQARKIATKS